MFDSLLGRSKLKERISELEAERDELREEVERLEAQLDAESERRSEAVSARQDAEERVNRLEDRIAQLEGEIERLEGDTAGPEFRGTERIRADRTGTVLDRLGSFDAGEEGALTAAVADGGDLPGTVEAAFGDRATLVGRAAPCIAVADDAGLVNVALEPPVQPDPFDRWGREFEFRREWFLPTGRFALALVRADLFAIGEYDGRERVDFEGFESEVKGDHSKGGFSQDRFERRRDDQIANHIGKCREAIADRRADRLYVVGDRGAIGEFEDEALATAAVDATGDPEDALEDAARSFWTTRLYRI